MTSAPLGRFPVLAALLAATAVLAGCSSPAPEQGAPADSADGSYPVTVMHAFGETTIPEKPQRIVALGANDLAVAQAVGAPVVGAVQNVTGSGPALPYLDPLPDEVLAISGEAPSFSAEQIATFDPDLILAVSAWQIADRASYDQLAAIAPVIGPAEGLYAASMQDDARQVGRAIGEQEKVEELITTAEEQIAEVRAQLPGLAGKTYLYGQARGEILPMVVGEQNQSTVFMRALGLDVPESFRNAPASDDLAPGTVGVSYEEVGRLSDADLLIMTFAGTDDRAAFEGNELVKRVRAVQEGSYTPVDLDTAVALQAPNPVSAGWLLDQLRPSLEKIAG
ncbi:MULTISPECIES: ABC transporter substrate-binding protein [Pseudonocardia]|uniref:ABC transporter substrate-binding protein n=2 Tax=Pseudonocardia TaxID=1847 RepID=A0ABQ0RWB1_9PSEU|nr:MULTISPECIES: ABC transporter substrate-binding protein [Pseudonocardia]OSY39696.1 putative ABC transporter substrate-binding lipoprotein YhfQ precursor [Pseudonocardia autotrophica]TDN72826.1 iron complex transport system substrate-binding protein [Pseudonocardia autotrophica]BBG03544.1 ABC transporter substrate-binding protein [Pseudonocardia autotrophica]GEC24964.1 ABC transporter substrate-binding protein [Pseudonocardia saturnea]